MQLLANFLLAAEPARHEWPSGWAEPWPACLRLPCRWLQTAGLCTCWYRRCIALLVLSLKRSRINARVACHSITVEFGLPAISSGSTGRQATYVAGLSVSSMSLNQEATSSGACQTHGREGGKQTDLQHLGIITQQAFCHQHAGGNAAGMPLAAARS